MAVVERSIENPLLLPNPKVSWEAVGAYNPSAVIIGKKTHLLYRALSAKQKVGDAEVHVSSIGHAVSHDGVHFGERTRLVSPEFDWERFGCEDPRVTAFEGRYFIFYTAVSEFSADGIKIAVAISKDLKTIGEKHLVTPFNAKAMALFPERMNGKIAAILTVHTDRPPARICIALFDRVEDIWSESYWKRWYADLASHMLGIDENLERDQVEVGAPPVKTKRGWLIFYSYIYNYFTPPAIFGVQALILDPRDLRNITGQIKHPFLIPREEYEMYGNVPHVVFPSGATVKSGKVRLYYGGADTVSCLATIPLEDLLEQLVFTEKRQMVRFGGNPIIAPIREHPWEAKATFNPAAIYEKSKVHILYRAMSEDNTSVLGYASSIDGMHVAERLPDPVYVPREDFERKLVPGGNSGCEDPRITKIGKTMYMCYTAFDGKGPPRVAFTSIGADDFIRHRWDWAKPVLISPPGLDDKDAALFPRKIGKKFWFLHRLGSEIWIDSVDDLDFDGKEKFLGGKILMRPRDTVWDSKRIGGTSPPIETKYGWLLLYHGISKRTSHYNIRAALLDLKDPTKVLYRTRDTLLEPLMPYEKEGIVSNVVFPCGAVMVKRKLYIYYGGADKYVAVASADADLIAASLARGAKTKKPASYF